jgi:hypothetical protein
VVKERMKMGPWLGYDDYEELLFEVDHHDRYFYYKDQMYGLSMEYDQSDEGNPNFSIQTEDPNRKSIFRGYDTWEELFEKESIDGIPFMELLKNGWKD